MYALVPDNLTLSSRVFMTPRFVNNAVDEGVAGGGVGDDKEPRCEEPGVEDEQEASSDSHTAEDCVPLAPTISALPVKMEGDVATVRYVKNSR